MFFWFNSFAISVFFIYIFGVTKITTYSNRVNGIHQIERQKKQSWVFWLDGQASLSAVNPIE